MSNDQITAAEASITTREAATRSLAIVGFIALVVAGMALAIYSARFVPDAVDGLANVSSFFTPSTTTLAIVPTASTTIPFGDATTSIGNTVPAPVAIVPEPTPTYTYPSEQVTPAAGSQTNNTYPVGSQYGNPAAMYGEPDLVTTINAVGYLTYNSTSSFVASNVVPPHLPAAVRFTIKNIGTNVAYTWRFSASIPTQNYYLFQSQPQQPLNPGDSIEYTLGFDNPNPGSNQTISVTANFDHAIIESNVSNDTASASVNVVSGY